MEKIGFIGAGKVGKAMAKYLIDKNFIVSGFYSKHLASSTKLADLLEVQFFDTLSSVITHSTLIFITTPDAVIEDVNKQIVASNIPIEDKIIIHCSGTLSSDVLTDCAKNGALTYSLHPLQAFTGYEGDVKKLSSTLLTVESRDQVNALRLSVVLSQLGNPYKWIRTTQKPLYHAAAVVMSNYMVTLVEEGLNYLRPLGFDDFTSISMMMPLLKSTLSNIESYGTISGLTGPIVRGDEQVIDQHIRSIENGLGQNATDFYKLMGQKTIDMIKDKRINEKTYRTLEAKFKE